MDRNYCHEHDEHGRGMLLFPTPPIRVAAPGPPPRRRSRPLPRKPPEVNRWRVLQGRDGAVLTDWMPEFSAHQQAGQVGGTVETWDEFVARWRQIYPLAPRKKRL